MARVQERATTQATRLLFLELEWVEVPDERADDAAGRRAPGVLRAPPAHPAPLPRPRAHRARGEGADRDVGGRLRRLGPPLRRADLGDRGVGAGGGGGRRRRSRRARRRRRHRGPRGRAVPAPASRPRACARRRPPRVTAGPGPGPAHPGLRVQHAAARQVDRRPPAALPVVDLVAQPGQRGERRVGAGAGRRRRGPLRHPPAVVPAQGPDPGRREARRLRPHGLGGHRRDPDRLGRGHGVSCSTPTGRSRPAWPTWPARSSRRAGSTPPSGRASARARSAPTRPPTTTPTCCSTGPAVPATWPRWPTSWATACTPTWRASGASFHQSTPLTLAETASVFGETVTNNALLATLDDPGARFALLAATLEDSIATVFRQVAMNRFEDAVHARRRTEGELSVDDFGELWAASQTAMLGDIGRGDRGLPHLVELHPALHRHPRLRLRLRLRPAAGPVGVRPLRGPGRRLRARRTSSCWRRGVEAAGRAGPHRRLSTSTTPPSGTPASTSSPASSIGRSRRPGPAGRLPANA